MWRRKTEQWLWKHIRLTPAQREIWDAYGDGNAAFLNELWKAQLHRLLADTAAPTAPELGFLESVARKTIIWDLSFDRECGYEASQVQDEDGGEPVETLIVNLPRQKELGFDNDTIYVVQLLLLWEGCEAHLMSLGAAASDHSVAESSTQQISEPRGIVSSYQDPQFSLEAGLLFLGSSKSKVRPEDLTALLSTPLRPSLFATAAPVHAVQNFDVLPVYKYADLPDDKQIRLLVFDDTVISLPNGRRQKTCSLQVFAQEHAPPYIALSYTWGPPRSDLPNESFYSQRQDWILWSDGRLHRMQIGQNLYDALQQIMLVQGSPAKALWVDAICINQLDVQERSAQVLIMGDIYSRCERVTIWLGKTPAEVAAQIVNVVRQLVPCIDYQIQTHGLASVVAKTWTFQDLAEAGMKVPIEHLITFQNYLRGSRWFTRVWIFQEVVLAPQAVVLLAHLTINQWHINVIVWFLMVTGLTEQLNVITEQISALGHGEESKLSDIPGAKDRPVHPFAILRWMDGARKYLNDTVLARPDYDQLQIQPAPLFLTFARTIDRLRLSTCEDPRDHCYAALSAVQRAGRDLGIKPDYSIPTIDVFQKLTEVFLRRLPSLSLLGKLWVAPTVPGLPTWVSDFTSPAAMLEQECYNASLDPGGDAQFTIEGSRLVLQGSCVGQVRQMHRLNSITIWDWLKSDRREVYKPDVTRLLEVISHLSTVDTADTANKYRDSMYGQDGLEILWRVSTANRTDNPDHAPLSNAIFRSWLACSMLAWMTAETVTDQFADPEVVNFAFFENAHALFPDSEAMPSLSMMKALYFPHLCHMRGNLVSKEHQAMLFPILEQSKLVEKAVSFYLGPHRLLYLLEDGRLGLGPQTMQEGDHVMLLKGGRMLYIMRPTKDEKVYSMVGETYVHGLMYGELVHAGVMDKLEKVTII